MSRNGQYSIDQIVSMKAPETPVMSPDGSMAAFVLGEASKADEYPVSDLWLFDVAAAISQQLTEGESRDANPSWSPCGQYITFESDRATRGESQIHVFALDTGEMSQITFQDGAATAPRWSPDGTMISCLIQQVETAEERAEKKDNGDQWVVDENPKRSSIWALDLPEDLESLIAGTSRPGMRKVSPDDVHVGTMMHALYDWAPDSSGFAAHVSESPKVDHLWCSEVATISMDGDVNRLGTFWGLFTPPSYAPDGKSIAFIGAGDASPMSVGVPYVVPVDGREAAKPLPLHTRGSANSITWTPDSSHVLVNLVESLEANVYAVTLADGSDRKIVQIGDKPGSIPSLVSLSDDGRKMTFLRADSTSPTEVWIGDFDGKARPVTDLNPWVRDAPVGDVREISWKSTDGKEIHGLLYLPVGYREGRKFPLLAHIHGGPMGAWTHRFYCSWHDWAMPMTQRGYAVFMPNPRGSSGRGPDYLAANNADLGGMEWADIETGIDHVIDLGIADPDQLVFGGWSYGGYFTNWAITHSDRFKAAVSGAAITNWVSFNGTTDVRRIFDAYFAEPVSENADALMERSPVRYFNRVKTPTLYVHGDADIRVPISQTYEMYYGVKDRGVETKMVVYPREPHMITERKHQADMLARVFDWFDAHLGR
jgi:dipeptidyl aminopeptidase/acylaminoacyl peptidase